MTEAAYRTEVGSSPRVRGKRFADHIVRGPVRIIPARAGQTQSMSMALSYMPDHPRACGANCILLPYMSMLHGSSPRVRGKQSNCSKPKLLARIIPARAGQTPRIAGRGFGAPDHPRACGANTGIVSVI